MCEGCRDLMEFQSLAEQILEEDLRVSITQPIDHDVFYGPTVV